MSTFLRGLGEENSVVGQYTDWITPDVRESTDQGGAVQGFKFIKLGPVDDSENQFTCIVWFTQICGNNAVELRWVRSRFFGGAAFELSKLALVQVAHNFTSQH